MTPCLDAEIRIVYRLAMAGTTMRRWVVLGILFHLLAVYFSVGYHGPDEHFQILEYVNFKLGKTPEQALTWEYREQMRPWFQPAVFLGLVRLFKIFGIENPHHWALGFRALSCALGLFASYALVTCFLLWFKTERFRHVATAATFVLWFLPYIHARTSSENWASSFFVIALALIALARSKKMAFHPIWVGIFFGLSFLSRYQMAVPIAFVFLWAMAIHRHPVKLWAYWLLGSVAIFALGLAIDRWGYGSWGWTPLNYIWQHVTKETDFARYPWWNYFRIVFLNAVPPISIVMMLGILGFWITHPRHLITWATLPLFISHLLSGHNQIVRHLFPMALFIPAMVFLALEKLNWKWERKFLRVGFRTLVWMNLLLVLGATLRAASSTTVFYQHLYERGQMQLFSQGHPFLLGELFYHFYFPEKLTVSHFHNFDELKAIIESKKEPTYLFQGNFHLPEKAKAIHSYCEADFRTIPAWTANFNINNWIERSHVWTLFRCHRNRIS